MHGHCDERNLPSIRGKRHVQKSFMCLGYKQRGKSREEREY